MLPYVSKFFASDRLAREAFTFLSPEFQNDDLGLRDPYYFGDAILELGKRLYKEGSLPGISIWDKEASPEILDSFKSLEASLNEDTGPAFNRLIQKAFKEAEAGFMQLGRLPPRLAGLRWASCMAWLACRSEAVDNASGGGGNVGTVSVAASDAANRKAKKQILDWLRTIVTEPPVIAMFDYDLHGEGVWHGGGREPVPPDGKNEWFRRNVEFDICRITAQVTALPPEDLNPSVPQLLMVQPYGTPHIYIPFPAVPRMILDKNNWAAEAHLQAYERLPAKAPVSGPVLHMNVPAPPVFDLDDPEIRAKVERGEDLGKGPQEDGLSGAVHGSVGLLYAAAAFEENIQNIWIYPDLLQLEGFVEMFLHFGPPFRSISLAGASGYIYEDVLSYIKLAGEKVLLLDFESCGLGPENVEDLVSMLSDLPNVRCLDLGDNALNAAAAIQLVQRFAEQRIDVQQLRLDGNPIGNPEVLKHEVGISLANRGASVVAGGDLVFHLGDNALLWSPAPRDGTLAQRLRDDGADVIRTSAVKDVERALVVGEERLKKFEQEPAAHTSGGRDWLTRMRKRNAQAAQTPIMKLFRKERAFRVNMMEKKGGPSPDSSPKAGQPSPDASPKRDATPKDFSPKNDPSPKSSAKEHQ